MIKRIKEYDKKAPFKDAHKIYIVCEGSSTEPDYFAFFEGLSSNLQVITIPSQDGKTDPIKLRERACSLFIGDERKYVVDYAQRDTIWFVIDTDAWEEQGKIQPLRDFCEAQNADNKLPYSAWNVAQSNPCFEIWLYYHLYESRPKEKEVLQHANFKEFVNHKYAGGFNFGKDPARLTDAISNTEANYMQDAESKVARYSSEMYVLGKEILNFVKVDICRLRNILA